MTQKQKVKEVINRLGKIYPQPHTALYFKTPLQLLIATILSAQTTDKLVNQITPMLFEKYQSAEDFANAKLEDLAKDIQKVNFHTNKAKNIIASCKIIHEQYKDTVPDNIQALDALPGVARKTANVVLGNAYHKAEGIVVDTHIIRLSNKLGLTTQKDPVKIEQDLMKIVPKDKWIDFSHLLINYGREYCSARPHNCETCPLQDLYPNK